ncbi:hypothetical protein PT974_12159 [Cladobotryum mycophilum]|uniref:BTB domain-containing protein n=1 Tax=Cladobotryum mycophilum TaxID=491253 RepID=A0ABR0S780_9HYPO
MMEAATLPSSKEESTVTIRIGTNDYLVDVTRMPYFESYIRFQQSTGQNTTAVVTHDDLPFFDIINDGVTNGFRQFFRKMPTQLDDYHVLCETLEFLCVDVVSNRNLHDIMKDLRTGKMDWDPEERRDVTFRSLARDSAFRLLYLFLLGDFNSEVKDTNAAYNAALFVVSHRAIFKLKARKMVREAFEERFDISDKQLKELNKWTIDSSFSEEEEDVTTAAEDTDFGSDWSY